MVRLPRLRLPQWFRTEPTPGAPGSRLVALDADGVLIDYHEGYAQAWERAFGVRPSIKDPLAYHPADFWDVPRLEGARLRQLVERGFTEETWRSMPALPGAAEACRLLRAAGYSLVCVTALRPQLAKARAENLQALGIPVDEVIATGTDGAPGNPKAAALRKLQPCLFVDDCLPFMQGLPQGIWRALVDVRPNRSPNRDPALEPPHSRHISVLDAARCWLAR
ncbi:HAD family hydrolase [Caldimonas tepidiphila]|uniref:HAD family hydrolase n=1 Tax=Caldimonas tepidiphila TaxID=2315841 RepID=UPI000E5A7CD1|nr:HAD family hydrolase [Caldimonas tepidiphila]